MSETITESERIDYLKTMENIISENGWFVQGVTGTNPYGYTIGRSDSGKREIYMCTENTEQFNIINQVCQLFDQGKIQLEKVFHLDNWFYGSDEDNSTPTVFMLTDRLVPPASSVIQGIYTRNTRLGRETEQPLVLVMGDSMNRLPHILHEDNDKGLATFI